MYSTEFDVVISTNNQNIKIMRNDELITELEGPAANDLRKKLVKLQEVKDLGFVYKTLDFSGTLNRWYELVLVEPSNRAEGVTLMYYPDRDIFEYPERDMYFTDLYKVESFIKAFEK